jgi:KaiC/GvpD/RAD55 family RecA-like ATPase
MMAGLVETNKNPSPLPPEIIEFFSIVLGRSLIIKGRPGAGKTILALELMENLTNIENCFYFTTRVSDETLYTHFPWLEEKEWRDRLIDASRGFLDTLGKTIDTDLIPKRKALPITKELASARDMLEAFQLRSVPRTIDRTMLNHLLEKKTIPELIHLYDRIELRLPKPSILVIDSIEGLSERYGLNPIDVIIPLQKDLVENCNTKLIVVLEKEVYDTMDYLADGVLSLYDELIDERLIRKLRLYKLRDVRIKRPIYIFTLDHGRFQHFAPFEHKTDMFRTTHDPIRDGAKSSLYKNKRYSTGAGGLDEVLKGGYEHGDFVLIELGHNVPPLGFSYLLGPTIENFLTQQRGVLIIVAEGHTPEMMRETYSPLVGKKIFDKYAMVVNVKVVDKAQPQPWLIDVGEEDCERFIQTWKNLYFQRKEMIKGPALVTCNWDALEAGFTPEDVEKIATRQISLSKSMGDLNIGVIKPGLEITQKLRNMANVHIKVDSFVGSLILYGEKPRTEFFNVGLTEQHKHPHLKLTPIV